MSLAEHGVFRLGDIVKHDLPQVWECLEERGLRVGAVSPMNAKNRLREPAFFVPDPWTANDHPRFADVKGLYAAVAQAVNENATVAHLRPRRYSIYCAVSSPMHRLATGLPT